MPKTLKAIIIAAIICPLFGCNAPQPNQLSAERLSCDQLQQPQQEFSQAVDKLSAASTLILREDGKQQYERGLYLETEAIKQAESAANNPRTIAVANGIVTCQEGHNCDDRWSRATAWIVKHSRWRIQSMGDNLISTYGPYGLDDSLDRLERYFPQPAFTVMRESTGGGTYTITLSVSCGWADNICKNADPKNYMYRASFNCAVAS
jgi:hypothetical protein